MSFPAYPSYQNTGVTWLGVRPSHWTLSRFKQVFRERDERSDDGLEELLSVSAYTGVSPRREIIDDGDHLSRAESLAGYKKCFPNDLVINIMLAWNRGLGFTSNEGIVSPAYCVFEIIDSSEPRYLNYLLRCDQTIRYFKAFSAGVIDSRLRLYPDVFLSLSCALPPPIEQAAIADFLDRETARIDALIEEQQRLIELLKEKRQAVISHAVTKGLDPTAPMKDSGVEWLGEVPAHWEVLPLKHIVGLRSGEGITSDSIDNTGDFPVFGGNGFRGFTDSYTHDGDYVLVGRQGALCGNINYASGMFWASEHALVASPNRPVVIRWLGELLRAMNLGQYSTSAAQPGLAAEVLGNLRCPWPPPSEQALIAALLEREIQFGEGMIAEAQAAINLLQERRSAVISAAVTGKIDVRGVLKPKPEFESSSYADL